jgi:hypothetical protein
MKGRKRDGVMKVNEDGSKKERGMWMEIRDGGGGIRRRWGRGRDGARDGGEGGWRGRRHTGWRRRARVKTAAPG